MKPHPLTTIIAVAAATMLTPNLHAQDITGSIGFGSLGASITGGSFASATSFTPTDPFANAETGVYTGVPVMTPVTFSGFQFNSSVVPSSPLWTFTIGATTYSYDATSISSSYNSALQQWDIGGTGVAMVTGYTPTDGTWNVNLSESGSTIVFDSSAAVTAVPEASTLALMGSGIMFLAGIGRKLKH
jgi:hypothetical protein